MRTHYQSVNDAWLGNAQALTTRIKITAKHQLNKNQQWQLMLQPNYVFAFNEKDFNSVTVTRHR